MFEGFTHINNHLSEIDQLVVTAATQRWHTQVKADITTNSRMEAVEAAVVVSQHQDKATVNQDMATVHLLDHLLLKWVTAVADMAHPHTHPPAVFKAKWATVTHHPLTAPLAPPNTPPTTSTITLKEE